MMSNSQASKENRYKSIAAMIAGILTPEELDRLINQLQDIREKMRN